MEIYYIEAGIFDRMLGCVESLSTRVDRLYEKNANKGVGEWLDGQDVCLRLDISSRTLQTLRDTGRLAFTQVVLVDEEIIYKKRGLGMFVKEGAVEKIRQKRQSQFYEQYVSTLISEALKLQMSKEDIISLIERGYDNECHSN